VERVHLYGTLAPHLFQKTELVFIMHTNTPPELSLEEIEFLFPSMHITRSSLKKGDFAPLHTKIVKL
jgi:hypothetical protein